MSTQRPIKFRVWNGERMWHPGGLDLHDGLVIGVRRRGSGFSNDEAYSVDEAMPLMQYTGMTDSEGREVYEGDVLISGSQEFIIEWDDEYGCYRGTNGIGPIKRPYIEACTILGNVYEHPHLV